MAYLIIGTIDGRTQRLTHASTRDEAQALVEEYSMILGSRVRVVYRVVYGKARKARKRGIE